MHIDTQSWTKLADEFRTHTPPDAPGVLPLGLRERVFGLMARAGLDFHHLLKSTDVLPERNDAWGILDQKPIGKWLAPSEFGRTEWYERSFWEEYWVLATQWLHEVPGSGVVLSPRKLWDLVAIPDGWGEPEYAERYAGHWCTGSRLNELEDSQSFNGLCYSCISAIECLDRLIEKWNESLLWRMDFSDCDQRKPTYDREARTLRLANSVVKQFRQPAKNQELVLKTFEELDWPERIDDPLPPKQGLLGQTVKDLNRNLRESLLRFKLDGRSEGITWERRT